jgi:phasin family protein
LWPLQKAFSWQRPGPIPQFFLGDGLQNRPFAAPICASQRPKGFIMAPEDMQKFGKEGMEMAMSSFGAWSKSAQAIAAEIVDYSKKSVEDSAAAWEKMLGAKSPEKAMEVQSAYLKSSYEDFVAEASKLGELYVDLAKEAYKPFEGTFAKMK